MRRDGLMPGLRRWSSATVVPYRRAMSQRVSPGCTVYVDWEYAGSGRRTAMSTAKSSTITAEAAAVFAKDRLATWATPSRSSVALAERRYAPGLSRPWQPRRQFRAQVVDRKSTRLNSSHVKISYAVFCLKKK